MTIPLLDLAAQYQGLQDEIVPAIEEVLKNGQFILGQEVEDFEDKFAHYCDAEFCIGVASGTEALHLALRALDIGPGDEVITAGNTFVATALAIVHTGATPVFVDIDPTFYLMESELVERAITEKTKAIIPVHLYGQPVNMDPILELARKYDLKVVEDACQAHGAVYRDRRVGSIGDVGCFSFYPGKNLGAYGDGGGIVTNSAKIAEKVRLLRNYGQKVKNVHSLAGFNSRLDTLQAAVLLVKLNHLDRWNDQRRRVARQYDQLLAETSVVPPRERDDVKHVYHLYVIQQERRDELIASLRDHNIFCGIHYPTPLHLMEPFRSARTVPAGLPVATYMSHRILSLPIYAELTDQQIVSIVQSIHSFEQQAVSV